ncbi:MAG: 6-phosphogluconolactonase [Gammaproteobacteria bacterium]|nr:6-phosphogluconolactonase [Gammaproteobacteria bacterium]
MALNEHRLDQFDEMVGQLTDRVEADINQAIVTRGRARIVVSGGSTPGPLFEALNTRNIDWEKVTVTLADERWVPPSHSASNHGLLLEKLLHGAAAKAKFVPLYVDGMSPESAKAIVGARIREVGKPFDLVLLGMGGDAHTASLFPDAPELESAMDQDSGAMCWPMHPPSATEARMTLTLPTLLHTRQVILMLRGWDKWPVYQKACKAKDYLSMPVAAVLNQDKVPVDVYWSE